MPFFPILFCLIPFDQLTFDCFFRLLFPDFLKQIKKQAPKDKTAADTAAAYPFSGESPVGAAVSGLAMIETVCSPSSGSLWVDVYKRQVQFLVSPIALPFVLF